MNIPSPVNFGWKEVSEVGTSVKWEPLWMTKVQAIKEMREFVKCGCKQPCTRCKCKDAQLNCTLLCQCSCGSRDSYEWIFVTVIECFCQDKSTQDTLYLCVSVTMNFCDLVVKSNLSSGFSVGFYPQYILVKTNIFWYLKRTMNN